MLFEWWFGKEWGNLIKFDITSYKQSKTIKIYVLILQGLVSSGSYTRWLEKTLYVGVTEYSKFV